MRKFLLSLLLCLVALHITVARADEAPLTIEQANQRLDRARSTLDEIGKTLAAPGLTDATLRLLRDRIDPLPRDISEVIDKLTPRLQAVEARVNELGAKRAEPPPPPPPSAAPPPPPEKPAPEKAPPPPQKAGGKPPAKAGAQKPAQAPAPAPEQKPAAAPEPPPAPAAEAASAVAASVNAEYAEQRKLFDDIDATLKRARALLLETQQTIVSIVAHQREIFAKTVFLQTSGLFSPALWKRALADGPAAVGAAASFFEMRGANFVSRLKGGHPGLVLTLSAVILLSVVPLARLSRRALIRTTDKTPTPLQKAAGAAWTAIILAAVPVAAVYGLWAIVDGFDLVDATVDPVIHQLFDGVTRVALTYAIAVAVLEPAFPQWRLWDPGDRLAHRLVRLSTLTAAILAIGRLVEQVEEIVEAALPVVIVSRGVGVLAIAALTIEALTFFQKREADEPAPRAEAAARRDWVSLIRVIGFTAVAVVLAASAAGYVTFANFFILQLGWLAAVAAVTQIVLALATSGVDAAFEPSSVLARILTNMLGLRRQQVAQAAVLLSGAATLLCWGAALLLALAPFGVESGDFLANLQSSFFAFKIGEVTISPYSALTALALFAATLAATQGLRRWLDQRYLPLTSLDSGLRNSISTSLGYAGFILSVAVALSHIGIGLERLAIVAGALSVGIGFGLQSIVNNFVSGLILLWERAIRVGDWVVVGDEQGYVKRINVRSTEIETFDRATMIVPNSNLVAGVVKNWLRGDKVGRIKIALAPHAGIDPEEMRDVMLAAARAQDGVLRIPAPQVMFLGMESNTFRFELWCYVEDVEQATRIRSDLYFDLHRRLAEAGITLAAAAAPAQPTIVQFPGLEKLAAAAAVATAAIEAGIGQERDEHSDQQSEKPPGETGGGEKAEEPTPAVDNGRPEAAQKQKELA